MNADQLQLCLPRLLAQAFTGEFEELPPGGTWILQHGGSVASVYVNEGPPAHLRVKAGVGLHVPLSFEVAYYVANKNRELWNGRLYLRSNPETGLCVINMEEIVFASALDEDHLASLQDLCSRIGTLTTMAGQLAEDVVDQFGGQRYAADDWAFLTL